MTRNKIHGIVPQRVREPRPETDALTERFFDAIESSGLIPSNVSAPEATAAVLGVLLQRLAATEARRVVAGLPESLFALLRPFTTARAEEPANFDRSGFLRLVATVLDVDEETALRLASVVFAAFDSELPAEQVSALMVPLRRLWSQDDSTKGV